MKKNSLLVGVLLLIGTATYAQKRFNANLHIAPSAGVFKTGAVDDFSSWGSITQADPNGFAGTGVGLGLDYHYAIQDKGLSLVFGMNIYRTPVKRNIRKAFTADEDFTDGTRSIKFSSYYNVAPKAGLQYGYRLDDKMELFGQATILYDILKISGSNYQYDEGQHRNTKAYSFNLSGAFGYEFRVGIALNNNYTVSIGYKNLGKHIVTRTLDQTSYWENISSTAQDQKNISMINLSLGLLF